MVRNCASVAVFRLSLAAAACGLRLGGRRGRRAGRRLRLAGAVVADAVGLPWAAVAAGAAAAGVAVGWAVVAAGAAVG